MSQVFGAFGLLGLTMLQPVLAWRALWNLWTVYFLNFPIFSSGRGKPRILNQLIRGHDCIYKFSSYRAVKTPYFIKRGKKYTITLTFRHFRVNNCCRGKAIGITYSECVSVASVIHHAKRRRHIVICGLSAANTIFHNISLTTLFWEGGKLFNIRDIFLYNFCLRPFSFS
jgi:hypothetical protein